MEWMILRRFVFGWLAGLLILVVISCVRHWEFITAAVGNNLWVLFNAAMPSVIIIFGIGYLLKNAFK